MKKLISFSGMIGSGKDTAASYLITHHGYKKASFSAVLKDVTAALFGWDRALLEGDTPESREFREQVDNWWTDKLDFGMQVTPRWALQYMGTEVMRTHVHQDIWMFCMERRLNTLGDKVVVTDARFLNELNLVRQLGGTTVGIYRDYPKWLEKFYQGTDTWLRQKFGAGLMERDLTTVENRQSVVWAAQVVATNQLNLTSHWSELEHLLYNQYDLLVDNTKDLAHLHRQVESVIMSL